MAAILIWPWEWRGTGENNESLLIFFKLLEKNCQRENHIIFLFYTLTSLESLFISLSLFGLPNTYSLVHFWRGTGKGGAGDALLPQAPLLAGWETQGLTVLLLSSFPSTCISQKNPGRLPKLPQNMNSLKRWIHMVAEAAPSSSGYHCHEECSEKRDLSGPHGPRNAWKCDSPSGSWTGIVPSQLSQCYWVLKFILGLKWGTQFGHLCWNHGVISSPWQRTLRGHLAHLALTSGWQDMEQREYNQ